MLATCRNIRVGLSIAHERSEQGWWSLMKEGSGVGERLISNSDGNRNGYNESDEGGDVATLQKEALAFD